MTLPRRRLFVRALLAVAVLAALALCLASTVVCGQVGCRSGVSIRAHLGADPQSLRESGAFRVCNNAQCWDGSFEGASATTFRCTVGGGQSTGRVVCGVREEPGGTVLTLMVESEPALARRLDELVNGDTVSLAVRLGDVTLVDERRPLTYEDAYPNGRLCRPRCRAARVDMTSSPRQ